MATSEPVVAHRKVTAGSDRSFGLVFSGFFVLVALLPLVHGGVLRWWALGVAAAFATVAFVAPRLLRPLNKVWFAFGMLLHHVVNPLVMAVLFYGAVVPTGLLARAFGKDFLRLKREPDAASYWIPRDQPAPAPKSMSKQF